MPNFAILKKLQEHVKQIGELVRVAQLPIESVKNLIMMQENYLINYAKSIQPFVEWALEMRKPEFGDFEREFGWMGFLPVGTMWGFYKIFKKDEEVKTTWNKIVSFLEGDETKKELESIFSSSNLFQQRMEILSYGLRKHVDKEYIASVSVLLPQLEGLIWDMGVKKGLVDSSHNSTYKVDSNGNVVRNKNGDPISWHVGELANKLWNEPHFEKYFREKVYSKEFRHPLLHGRALDFFTAEKSTCIILLLIAVHCKTMELNL